MVLEIKLNNFFSFKDEVILDMRAGNIKSAKSKLLSDNISQYDDIDVLKSIGIYGANASGKTNLFKTIRFCNAMVFDSHKHNENDIFNFLPFKFEGCQNKPSSYFIRFIVDEIEYTYSFSLTRNEILTEKLYYYPKGRKAKIFERDESKGSSKKEKYSFGSSVIRRPLDVAENTSRKSLYISRGSQMDRDIPKRLFKFFHSTFILRHSNYGIKNLDKFDNNLKKQMLKALQFADSDIVDFKTRFVKEKGKKVHANFMNQEAFIQEEMLERLEIKTYHRSSPKTSFNFLTEESEGTKKFFFMMLTILDVVRNNKILLIDEIEDSLHPAIVDYIIKLFNASEKAQLIFSTHSTSLLDLNKFRKDQIWFVNKLQNGSSDLFSLYDYNDFRDTMDLEKAYLQGRFDSIPIVDDSKISLESLLKEEGHG